MTSRSRLNSTVRRLLPVAGFVVLLIAAGCGGKGPVLWSEVIVCPGDDVAAGLDMFSTSIVAVGTKTPAPGAPTSWVVQLLDTDGNQKWRRFYSEGQTNSAGDVAFSSHGGLYVVGSSRIDGKEMAILARYRLDGNIAWQKALVVGDESRGNGLAFAGDTIIVCGVAKTKDKQDLMVAMFTDKGERLWARNHDFGPVDEGTRVTADGKGGFVIVGQTGTAESLNVIVAKFDAKGDTVWTRSYDSGMTDRAGDVAVDIFGNVIATGTAQVGVAPRCVILEYHPDGELIRETAYGQQTNAEGNAVFTTGKGDIFIAGTLHGGEKSQALAFQYQPNATNTWERFFGERVDHTGADLIVDEDVFVLGTKMTADGAELVVSRFWRPLPEEATN